MSCDKFDMTHYGIAIHIAKLIKIHVTIYVHVHLNDPELRIIAIYVAGFVARFN